MFAEDFKTLDGREYKDATIQGVELDGIRVKTKSGISKLYFVELPKEVQDRFGYGTPQNRYMVLQQQEHDLLKQIGEAEQAKACLNNLECKRKAKHSGRLSEMAELAARLLLLHKELDQVRESMRQLENPRQLQPPTNSIQTLQTRNLELIQQEDDLLLRIGEAEHKPKHLGYQLPYLRHRLQDVRQEKEQTRKQLEQAQHQ